MPRSHFKKWSSWLRTVLCLFIYPPILVLFAGTIYIRGWIQGGALLGLIIALIVGLFVLSWVFEVLSEKLPKLDRALETRSKEREKRR